jgi:hypothetical protein
MSDDRPHDFSRFDTICDVTGCPQCSAREAAERGNAYPQDPKGWTPPTDPLGNPIVWYCPDKPCKVGPEGSHPHSLIRSLVRPSLYTASVNFLTALTRFGVRPSLLVENEFDEWKDAIARERT